jgi:ferredoxin-NADP reductase
MTETPNTTVPTSTKWRVGTVRQIRSESPDTRTFTFALEDGPVKHASGQHYELRLTADDGYQAARLYSAASPASGRSNMLQLTIGLMPYGEVSPYLFRHATVDSQFEIRGPLGRYFVWSPAQTEPILLVGGGIGVVPLRSIWQEHMMSHAQSRIALLYSASSYTDVVYKYELMPDRSEMPRDVILTFTEQAPRDWTGYSHRLNSTIIADSLVRFDSQPTCYVCGPTPFVESAASLLIAAGVPASNIKAERFGPTGV